MAKRTRRAEMPEISTDNQIVMYLHCAQCVVDYDKESHYRPVRPAHEARLNVGWTPRGMQVWCARHNCNVLNVDYEGMKHPAVTARQKEPDA